MTSFTSCDIHIITCFGDISNRCREAWNAVPRHLRYSQDCWASNSPAVALVLGKVYGQYLHNNFLILQLLGKWNASFQPELLEVSAAMLDIAVQLANARNRTYFFPRDLPAIV